MNSFKSIFICTLLIIAGVVLLHLAFTPTAFARTTCAQNPSNLIRNGTMAAANPDNGVAAYWNALTLGGSPHFEHVDNESWDVDGAQYIWSSGDTFDAVIYQTVTGLTPGAYYKFEWDFALARYDDGNQTESRGNFIARQLGIDLTGGTNPTAPTVVWGNEYWDGNYWINVPDLSRTFAAQTDRATFFLRNINTDSQWVDKAWIDTICLSPTTAPVLTPRVYLPLVLSASAPTCTTANTGTIPVGTHPKAIAVDPATNRVFVALFDDSNVAVINAATNAVSGTWGTNSSGRSNGIGVTGGKVFVALHDTNSVAVLDATTGSFITSRGVGSLPYGIGAANGTTWVANFSSNSVSVIDAATNNVTATPSTGGAPSLVAPGTDRAFVSYWDGGVQVIGMDGTVISNFISSGSGSFGVALNTNANRLYVTTRSSPYQLFALDSSTGALIKNVSLGQEPFALAYNPATNHLFVVLANENQVDVRDGTTLNHITTVSVGTQGGDGGDGIAVMNGRVYVSNNSAGTVSVLTDSCP